MSITMVPNIVGALITLALGLLGLLAPTAASKFTQLQALSRSGFAEFRSTFGGLFVGLGVCLLLFNQPTIYLVVGIAWLATALGRALSIILDKGGEAKNYQGFVLEALVGVLLVVGNFG
jgi:hypothetical protein